VNERADHLSGLAQLLDRPAAPRSEFAAALLERLLEELEPSAVAPGPKRRWTAPLRSPKFALALVAGVLGALVAGVVLTRPQRASALDVIRQARQAFASTPPFQATIRFALKPDGSKDPLVARGLPRGATETLLVSYGGPRRFRAEIVDQRPRLRGFPVPGAYTVFDGRRLGSFDPRTRSFYYSPPPAPYRPIEFLKWRGTYPDWERVCATPYSKVLANARLAGRDARHIRCGNFHGDVWELWIDRQTGVLLKLVGQVGGDDTLFGPGYTSTKGGFEIERVSYNPAFASRTFSVAAPPGVRAVNTVATRQAALAKVPPFRAVFAVRSGRIDYVDEAWWLNERTWRRQRLVDRSRDANFTGAGSFTVWARGHLDTYTANDKTFSRTTTPDPGDDPAVHLLASYESTYSPARCPIVGHERIAGRETDHHRCTHADLWVDRATGVTMKERFLGSYEMRVRSIKYNPHFPSSIFAPIPPAGSRNPQELPTDPYYRTKLRPGNPAPNWHAATLAGGRFQLTDLRGKPALLLLLPDWCSDPACNDLAPLEKAYRRSHDTTTVVWVDFQGSAQEAKKLARFNHLTFPVVVDPKATSLKTWAIEAFPYWLLLDSSGRVVEARLKPQTVAQLTTMLAEQRAPR
jgi:peroxiredoxin